MDRHKGASSYRKQKFNIEYIVFDEAAQGLATIEKYMYVRSEIYVPRKITCIDYNDSSYSDEMMYIRRMYDAYNNEYYCHKE